MKKWFLLIFLMAAQIVLAGEVFQVPKTDMKSDKAPSVAENNAGDVLVAFRNRTWAMSYYWRKSGSSDWIGPAGIPNQDMDFITSISKSECVATPDNKFHVVWDGKGIWYASFDPATETWSDPEKIVGGNIEDPRLKVNPLTGEVWMVMVWKTPSKDIHLRNINTNTDYIVGDNPYSDTNPDLEFDSEGYAYITWKEDKLPYLGYDRYVISAAVYDTNMNRIFRDYTTWQFDDKRYLPTIACVQGKGIVAHAIPAEGMYNYQSFTRSGSTVDFGDYDVNEIAPCPTMPHFRFMSRAIPHGDKIYYFYVADDHTLKLSRYQDGQWIDDLNTPEDISAGITVNMMFHASSCSKGIWLAWYDNLEPYTSYFTFVEAALILPAVNVTHEHFVSGSLYTRYYVDLVSWEDNPDNTANDITVANFKIYHRDTSATNPTWVLDGEVAADVYQFAVKNVPAADVYEYGVACVDDIGNESSPAEVKPVVSTPQKTERTIE